MWQQQQQPNKGQQKNIESISGEKNKLLSTIDFSTWNSYGLYYWTYLTDIANDIFVGFI